MRLTHVFVSVRICVAGHLHMDNISICFKTNDIIMMKYANVSWFESTHAKGRSDERNKSQTHTGRCTA